MTAQEIIQASETVPVDKFAPAMEIVKVFRDNKLVYVPKGDFFLGFWKMIAAIWYGGYMAGVQAERRKRRSR